MARRVEAKRAAVADDKVITGSGFDRIVTVAGHNNVVTFASVNYVVAIIDVCCRCYDVRIGFVVVGDHVVHGPAVTHNHVATAAGGDFVVSKPRHDYVAAITRTNNIARSKRAVVCGGSQIAGGAKG